MTGREWFAHVAVVVALLIVLLGVTGVLDMREQSYLDQLEPVAVADTGTVPAGTPSTEPSPSVQTATPPTSPTVAEVVAVLDVPADPLVQRGEPVPGTTLPIVGPTPGDCAAWAEVFRSHGATELEVQFFFGNARPWGVPRTNIIGGETDCGRDFINENTSDRYVCQLNGVHSEPGYSFGTYYGPGGWMLELFGLRGGRAVTTQAEASTPDAVPACLWLLRGGFTPDAFAGVNHWQPV